MAQISSSLGPEMRARFLQQVQVSFSLCDCPELLEDCELPGIAELPHLAYAGPQAGAHFDRPAAATARAPAASAQTGSTAPPPAAPAPAATPGQPSWCCCWLGPWHAAGNGRCPPGQSLWRSCSHGPRHHPRDGCPAQTRAACYPSSLCCARQWSPTPGPGLSHPDACPAQLSDQTGGLHPGGLQQDGASWPAAVDPDGKQRNRQGPASPWIWRRPAAARHAWRANPAACRAKHATRWDIALHSRHSGSWWQPCTLTDRACRWAEALHTRVTAGICPCLSLKELSASIVACRACATIWTNTTKQAAAAVLQGLQHHPACTAQQPPAAQSAITQSAPLHASAPEIRGIVTTLQGLHHRSAWWGRSGPCLFRSSRVHLLISAV